MEAVFPIFTGPASECLELGLLVLPLMCVCAWTSLLVGWGPGTARRRLFAAVCTFPRLLPPLRGGD